VLATTRNGHRRIDGTRPSWAIGLGRVTGPASRHRPGAAHAFRGRRSTPRVTASWPRSMAGRAIRAAVAFGWAARGGSRAERA
jgi:hypothetical protein